MAAPQIPNLLTLRGRGRDGRGGSQGRGRASSSSGFESVTFSDNEFQNEIDKHVQFTDLDASYSRLSAASLGYLNDVYASEFHRDPTPRRQPIINRGTYVRTTAIDRIVESFIASNAGRYTQIISLGAGTDTRYWRLREKRLHVNLLYHEIDFPETSEHKLDAIRSSRVLSPIPSSFFVLHNIPEIRARDSRWGFFRDGLARREGYLFHPCDLRRLPAKLPDLISDVPTLLISECALCYLSNADAKRVIINFTSQLPTLGIVLYEPTGPNDEFGRMMIQNLASRHLLLPSMKEYPDIGAQKLRLAQADFSHHQNGATVSWLWKNWVSNEEKVRLSKIEMIDEVEEWELLSSHYLVMWGYREFGMINGAFDQWKQLPGEIYSPPMAPVAKMTSDQGTDEEEDDSDYGPYDDYEIDDSEDNITPTGPPMQKGVVGLGISQ